MGQTYDVIVIGGGSAGLTAGLFTVRYGHSTLVIEQLMGGGQIINADKIENYPGFPQGTTGFELGPLMQEQAMDAGAEFLMAEATGISVEGSYNVVNTADGKYKAKAVIIAGGSSLKTLGIPGEKELTGKGVSHCATCDGPFFQDKVAGVVGGGDSSMDESLTLTEYASQVVLFHRRDTFRSQKVLQQRILSNPKIMVRWNTVVEKIVGDASVTGVNVRDTVTGEQSHVELSALFVQIGLAPNTLYLREALSLDNAGHVPTDIWMATELPGVFAAGDIRQNSAAQVITVAGDGATAAISAHRYISGRQWA